MAGYASSDFPIEWPRYRSVQYLGYLPSYADVVRLVSHARALLFLSYSEGFGLPMLEAQTLGVPLIVNPRNPMVGELLPRGSYVSAGNVGSPASIKVAIDVAARDADALVAAGIASAKRFEEATQVKKMLAAFERHSHRLGREGWGT
jgi:glycosyltransferase involved in cell wall biosynthesis